ncbi:14917_t:CDS:2, partial [Cetraspora pellucida]
MSIYYKQPILLIKFEQNQTFTLQAINYLKSDINIYDISSKLDLKESPDQPDLETVQSIGVENEDITDYNLSPQDILRALPGITAKNYKHIMSKVENLRKLTIIFKGVTNLGKTLYGFLERN